MRTYEAPVLIKREALSVITAQPALPVPPSPPKEKEPEPTPTPVNPFISPFFVP